MSEEWTAPLAHGLQQKERYNLLQQLLKVKQP